MTKPDLSGCYAKLNWADAQINVLEGEVHSFLDAKPYTVAEDPNIEPNIRVFKLKMNGQVTDVIRVAIGQIIAAQRDSLDYLAVALAKNNGAQKDTDVYFPVAETKDVFFEAAAQKKIRRLSQADRDTIAAFQPYKGGNEPLFALHWLNLKGKHREPIAVFDRAAIANMSFSGNGYVRRITVWDPDNSPEPGVPYVRFDADPGVNLNFPVQIAFGEIGKGFTPPVIETLRDFSRLAKAIIDTFK